MGKRSRRPGIGFSDGKVADEFGPLKAQIRSLLIAVPPPPTAREKGASLKCVDEPLHVDIRTPTARARIIKNAELTASVSHYPLHKPSGKAIFLRRQAGQDPNRLATSFSTGSFMD